jgi:hypothetical protein
MKKLLFIILMMAFILPSFGQEIQREGKTFSVVKKEKSNTEILATGYQYQMSDSTYQVYQAKKGGSCFVLRVSKKTGKTYRYYIPKEISVKINEELGTPQEVKNSKEH